MNLERLQYRVEAEVRFTPEEVEYLIARAQVHYDATCRAAGMSYEDGARENGFIKQLKLFPSKHGVVWTFRQLDITLKILENFAGNYGDLPIRRKLANEIHIICDTLQQRHSQLQKEEEHVKR